MSNRLFTPTVQKRGTGISSALLGSALLAMRFTTAYAQEQEQGGGRGLGAALFFGIPALTVALIFCCCKCAARIDERVAPPAPSLPPV